MGSFNKGERSRKGGRGSFCSKTFYNGYENLIESPKKVLLHLQDISTAVVKMSLTRDFL